MMSEEKQRMGVEKEQHVGLDSPEASGRVYQAPEIRVLGALVQMTQENFTGTNGDSMFLGFGGTS
jgi:hypothetical protein